MRILHCTPLALAVLALACAGKDANGDGITDGVRDPSQVTLVAPSTPTGTISGQVLNMHLAPLDGATVSLNVGTRTGDSATATTDSGGNFSFANVPAGGQVLLTFSKPGYGTVRASAEVPATAGNFPIDNGNVVVGPIALTQLSSQLRFQVVTHSGRPASGVHATLEAAPAGTLVSADYSSYGASLGLVVGEATADDKGMLVFSGMPSVDELSRVSGRYDLTVSAFDADADGTIDFFGTYVRYQARSLVVDTSVRVIELADARASAALSITSSNLDSMLGAGSTPLRNAVKPGEALTFVFNQPVLANTLSVKLVDESGVTGYPVQPAVNGTMLTVPLPVGLEADREYNVAVKAVSAVNGSTLVRAGYLFLGDPANPKPVQLVSIQYRDVAPANPTTSLYTGDRVIIRLSQPVRLLAGNPAEAFVDYDFDASGTKGNIAGEVGSAWGFSLIANEPVVEPGTQFALQASGYTTRFEFTFSGATVAVPNATSINLAFGRLLTATGGYVSMWGLPVTNDLSAGVTPVP